MSGKGVVAVIRGTVAGYGTDRVPLLAAALAFFAMFAMAPLLIIVIEIGAALLGGSGHHDQVRNALLNRLQPAIGKDGATAIAAIVQATFEKQSEGLLSKIVAWVFFVVAATGFFGSVQGALDVIWAAPLPGGFAQAIFLRLKSFAIIAGVALFIVAMVVATTALGAVGGDALSQVASPVLMVLISTVLFAVLYKWLSPTQIGWPDVFLGSAVTAALSVAGQYAIGFYLGRASTTSAYGAAGSLAAILLWLYYSATIFLIGAELIKAYAKAKA
ncbi:MAG TPA: YihY/virulence factor BrkB family protein [Candidatus Aquilonibacter sp.]